MSGSSVRKIDMSQYCALEFFKTLPLFINLPPQDIKRFSDASRVKTYKKGKLLFIEAQKAEYFYIILSGWIKLFLATTEGEELNLAILTGHMTIGENALFDNGYYRNSAEVVEEASALCIPLSLLKSYLAVSQQMAFNMLTVMAQFQHQHILQLEVFHQYSAPQRIGCFLLGLCPPAQLRDGVKLNFPYDKTLIASTLGMRGATFSRALQILRKKTGIQAQGMLVTIDSVQRLLDFVDGCYLDILHRKI